MRPLRSLACPTLFLALPALTGCASLQTAFSNVNLFSPEDDVAVGKQAYTEILQGQPTQKSGSSYQMCKRVTDRLVAAAAEEDPELTALFEWEVSVIEDPNTVNAFCLPGGKMAVYTGILTVAQGDAGLAVVMGHEIAHATRRHGTEALTRQGLFQNTIAYLAGDYSQLAGLGVGLLSLSFGRGAELEADRAGLLYMARAGYDPREAVAFWQRMDALGGEAPPRWLSTHPPNADRIAQIEERLPEALEVWKASVAAAQP